MLYIALCLFALITIRLYSTNDHLLGTSSLIRLLIRKIV